MKIKILFLVICASLILFPSLLNGSWEPVSQSSGTVVLAFPQDPYTPLAEEIAQAESLPLVQSWEEALEKDPTVILWVVSPAQLSDPVMVAAGMAIKESASLPSVGIFSGSTQNNARQLWQRGQALRKATGPEKADLFYAANGEHATAGIAKPQLIAFQSDQEVTASMDKQSLADALQQADYLTFTGHGADRYLRIDPDTQLFAQDVPTLSSVIVSTASCQTFRLWRDNSIALSFINKGAAAYAGFVYSPIAGFMIGQFEDLPFRYTWPDFPIGNVVTLQNRGTMQGFANFPFFFLLGDPRIALQTAPSYEVIKDEEVGNARVLEIHAPEGIIPVRVRGGGRYRFVEIAGLASTADGDPFFNARIQATSQQGDKFILVNNPGGDFSLKLQELPPWHWQITHPLLAAFDDVSLFAPQNGGDVLLIAIGVVFLAVFFLRWRKLKKSARSSLGRILSKSIVLGIIVALLMSVYQLLRLPHAAITAKPMDINPFWAAGVFLLTLSASALFLVEHSRFAKLIALLVGVTPALLPGMFGLLYTQGFNLIAAREIGGVIYNAHMGTTRLVAVVPWLLVLWIGLWGMEKKL